MKCKCGHHECMHRIKKSHHQFNIEDGIKLDGSCGVCEVSKDGEEVIWECECKKFEEVKDECYKCGHGRLNHFNQGEYREDGLEFPKGCKMVGCLCNKFKEVRE